MGKELPKIIYYNEQALQVDNLGSTLSAAELVVVTTGERRYCGDISAMVNPQPKPKWNTELTKDDVRGF